MGDVIDEVLGGASTALSVVVSGYAGTGRGTVAAALTERFGLRAERAAPDVPEPDLRVRVLGATVRAVDLDAVSSPGPPWLIVSGKADLRDDPRHARLLADSAAAELGRPVHPVSALLARATVTADDWSAVCRWASCTTMPILSSAFLDVDDDAERTRRRGALQKWGPAGLRLVLDAAQAGDDPRLGELATSLLRESSGFGALVEPIRALGPQVAVQRERARCRTLNLLAASGRARDHAELALQR
ncbi:MAG: hypothetical protein QM658_00315 [Gordonia sp. (in: high G+C Gram-positive bacteria)]